jgi:hypothetical protein
MTQVLQVVHLANQRPWGLAPAAAGTVRNLLIIQEAPRKVAEHTQEAPIKAMASATTVVNTVMNLRPGEVIRVLEVVRLANQGYLCILATGPVGNRMIF